MRTIIFAFAAWLAAIGSASALEAGETMKAWAMASKAERSALLDRMLGQGAGKPSGLLVRKCVDEASAIPGHAGLAISQVVSACQASESRGEPV